MKLKLKEAQYIEHNKILSINLKSYQRAIWYSDEGDECSDGYARRYTLAIDLVILHWFNMKQINFLRIVLGVKVLLHFYQLNNCFIFVS